MLEKIRDNFFAGVSRVKWFSSLLSERLKIELTVIKLINDSKALEEKRDDMSKTVGMRVFELRKEEGVDIFKDAKVKEGVKEMERLTKEIEDLRARITEIGQGSK